MSDKKNPPCTPCGGFRFDHKPGCPVPCSACGWEPEHGHKYGCSNGPLEPGQTRWAAEVVFRGYDRGEDLALRIRTTLGTHPTLSFRVDDVRLRIVESTGPSDRFLVYVGRQSGAELLWVAADGGPPTPDLHKARVCTRAEALDLTSDPATYDVAYPYEAVYACARITVSQLPDPEHRVTGRS